MVEPFQPYFNSVYANYISPSVMTDANFIKVQPVKGSQYVMIKLLKMTDVS